MNKSKLSVLLFLLAGFCLNLTAGVVVRTQETNAGGQVVSENEIFCKDHLLALQSKGEDKVIFNSDSQTFTIVINSEQSYFEIGEEQIEQLGEVMANAQRQIEQALQAVPASQRERMRQMMASRMPGLGDAGQAKPELSVEATGEQKEISGFDTRQYIIRANGQRVTELWVADWDALEGGADLQRNLQGMAGFMQNMMSMMPSMGLDLGADQDTWMRTMDDIPGFPVESHHFEGRGNRPQRTTTLVSVESKELDAGLFRVPEGFRRQEIEMPSF